MKKIIDFILNIRNIINADLLFVIAILLLVGLLFGKLAEKIKLPSITGYILAGLILGPSISGLVPNFENLKNIEEKNNISKIKKEFNIVSEESNTEESLIDNSDKEHQHHNPLNNITYIALGIISFTIGGEFSIKKLKKTGKAVIIMTLFQLLLSFILVSTFLIIFKFNFPLAFVLGSIATATAPAATVAIIQSLKAKGPFVDYLYGIVALDDAGAVILFGIMFSIASALLGAESGIEVSAISIIIHSVLEVVFSILTGAVFGLIFNFIIRKGIRKNITTNEQLIITISLIFLATAISISLHMSPLLTNMVLGGVLINLSGRNEHLFNLLGPLTPPIYALFFAIAGTELNIFVLLNPTIILFGMLYVLARAIGKYFGIYFGAIVSKAETNIRNYLGLAMIPQAGVAIGLSMILQNDKVLLSNPQIAESITMVVSIVLFSVFVNEIVGPPLSKFAIMKSCKCHNV